LTAPKDWKSSHGVPALAALGLTELEASIYCHLVESGATTGYQVAKAIGKPVANAYKALYTLEEKGAVRVEEGEKRRCRAVPPRELLARLEREFRSRKAAAKAALAQAKGAPKDDNVYRVEGFLQVLERASSMLREARKHVVVDAFPSLLEELREDVEKAIARGVGVLVEAYEPVQFRGARVALHPSREEILPIWPGEMLSLAVDGREWLQAFVDRETREVQQAVWTANPFLATHAYLASVNNVVLSRMLDELQEGASTKTLRSTLKRSDGFRLRHTLGFQELTRRGRGS